MKSINAVESAKVLDQLQKQFRNNTAWNSDLNPEISFSRFFLSSMFSFEGKQGQKLVDWKVLKYFALYTCKQNTDTQIHRIAEQIARESTQNKAMERGLFEEVIKMICKMASTKLMKAVAEEGYMEDFYNPEQYDSLNKAAD